MLMVDLLALMLLLGSAGLSTAANSSNLCPGLKGCKCSSAEPNVTNVQAYCDGPDPDIQHLPLERVTHLSLTGARFSNVSVLWNLRRANLSHELTLEPINPPSFNWEWLPDTCTYVSLSSYLKQIRFSSHPRLGTSLQNSCIFRSTLNVTKIKISTTGNAEVPKCIPNSTEILYLNSNLSPEFHNGNLTVGDDVRWPPNLRTLDIGRATFTNIDAFLRNLPLSVENVRIRFCSKPLIRFPSSWLPKNTIKSVVIMSCGTNETTEPDVFSSLASLEKLELIANKIQSLPDILPSKLKYIVLSINLVSNVNNVRWKRLTSLIRLVLENNKLSFVPTALPVSLERLNLRKNMIKYCSPTDFSGLRKLRFLDMSKNRLVEMPENLPKTMEFLLLNNNLISAVRSPASYEFCVNCTSIMLNNNPWTCDQNMAKFQVWLAKKKAKTMVWFGDNGPCGDVNEMDRCDTDRFVAYAKYLNEHFSYCSVSFATLNCSNSAAKILPDRPLKMFKYIRINNLPNLTTIPVGLFKDLKLLVSLNLQSNGLVQFPRQLPSSLVKLQLSNNKISSISSEDQDTLNNLPNLQRLYLDHNLITSLYSYQLLPLKSLKFLWLLDNPLHCDCSIRSLTIWYKTKGCLECDIVSLTPTCQSPPAQQGSSITTLWGSFVYEYICVPLLCRSMDDVGIMDCSKTTQLTRESEQSGFFTANFYIGHMPVIPNNSYWKILDLSGLQLTSENVSARHLLELETVNLTDNALTSIPIRRLPKSLKNLILTRNKISSLPLVTNVKSFLPNLEYLDLRSNNITTLDQNGIKLIPSINSIELDGNPLICDCDIQSLVIWIQANEDRENASSKNNMQNLVCTKPSALRGTLIKDLKKTEYCPGPNFTGLIVGLVSGVLLLLIGAFIINIYLHKRRQLKERHDIVQGFRDLLEKEASEPNLGDEEQGVTDETHFEYDAFISYRCGGRDEDFAYDLLEEMEECRQRKICLHERDFIPGHGIANNIVKSIVASRKVILVISRKYATSSWCQYEVQVALAELHKKRRGKLLIPLLLEDVTKDEEYAGSVKTILSAISGLHVPAHDARARAWREFWNKLDEALN